MDRCYIRNRIATLTNTDVNIYDVLGDGILRRCVMLFEQDYVDDLYTCKLYFLIVSAHFSQKGNQEQAQKYRNMAYEEVW